MATIGLSALLEASQVGGPAALSMSSELTPAGGSQALVAPAKYTSARGGATYVTEQRYIGDGFKETVLLDSRPSVANRVEEALTRAAIEGHPVLSLMPSIRVTYTSEGETVTFRDTEVPARAYDAHIRLGAVEDTPVTSLPEYRAARDSNPQNAWALFSLSPLSVLAGCWDSTRKRNQARFPAAFVGEIIGVIADEHGVNSQPTHRSGARIDPLGAQVLLDASVATALADRQADDISDRALAKIRKQKGQVSASNLGLGAIPPGTADTSLDGIATSSILRNYTLSFSTLRRLRFGKGVEGDASLRALLAAIALAGIARNDAELYLRANCHLVEAGPAQVRLDRRGGEIENFDGLTIAATDALLSAAFANAVDKAGLDWHGQTLEVTGDPAVLAGARSADKDDAAQE